MANMEKVLGAIVGMAIGDAMGMPTELMTPQRIDEAYGVVCTLLGPDKSHYHHGHLVQGQFTDDTEQMLAIFDAYCRHGEFSAETTAEALILWAKQRDVFNSTYLGPSSRTALQHMMQGEDPKTTGQFGTTVGSAMRVLPIAVMYGHSLEQTARLAVEVSVPTHATSGAIAGACAMAAALAAALKKEPSINAVFAAAQYGAEFGVQHGYPYPAASIPKRMAWARQLVQEAADPIAAGRILYDYVGGGMVAHEIIPSVLALFSLEQFTPLQRLHAAVNMGGDTDTIAALLGSLLGACYGASVFPADMRAEIEEVNRINFSDYTAKVLAMKEKYAKVSCPTGHEGRK